MEKSRSPAFPLLAHCWPSTPSYQGHSSNSSGVSSGRKRDQSECPPDDTREGIVKSVPKRHKKRHVSASAHHESGAEQIVGGSVCENKRNPLATTITTTIRTRTTTKTKTSTRGKKSKTKVVTTKKTQSRSNTTGTVTETGSSDPNLVHTQIKDSESPTSIGEVAEVSGSNIDFIIYRLMPLEDMQSEEDVIYIDEENY